MEALSKVQSWLMPILLAVIGFFLIGVVDDIKEIKGEVVQLREAHREAATRIELMEKSLDHYLAATDSSPRAQQPQPQPQAEYSGGHHPDKTPTTQHGHRISFKPSKRATTYLRTSNTGGGSGGNPYLCCDTEGDGIGDNLLAQSSPPSNSDIGQVIGVGVGRIETDAVAGNRRQMLIALAQMLLTVAVTILGVKYRHTLDEWLRPPNKDTHA